MKFIRQINSVLFSLVLLSSVVAVYPMVPLTIHEAVKQGDIATVRQLLAQKPALINAQDGADHGNTLLHLAARHGREAIAVLLLENGATVDMLDQEGHTPLHLAAFEGFEAIVRLLLTNGAKLNTTSRHGRTPLDMAMASLDASEVVIKLLQEWPILLRQRLSQARITFFMGLHQRLGRKSHLSWLGPDPLRYIAMMLKPEDFCNMTK